MALDQARRRMIMIRTLAQCVATFVALSAVHVEAGRFTLTDVAVVPQAAVLSYDPQDGNLSLDGNGVQITTFELILANSLFIWSELQPPPDGCFSRGPFDVFIPNKLFMLNTAGVSSCVIGKVLPAELSAAFLLEELSVDGSIKPSGKLPAAPGGGPFLYVVPEPCSSTALSFGLLLLLVGWPRSSPCRPAAVPKAAERLTRTTAHVAGCCWLSDGVSLKAS
jgi:hypothetical protein